ncbi:hypothetical protein KIN20_034739 [Parelaphostrongylus tenuis]|uniref:Uncharacterized protein n=1 Tax=Parelaphostrongylus tenuis TaxID=148309 RepID=A0AAD5RAK7_PARTN|nr:hypothetical protein KIN20_034739 [Parelaphostrongylus tenuis]
MGDHSNQFAQGPRTCAAFKPLHNHGQRAIGHGNTGCWLDSANSQAFVQTITSCLRLLTDCTVYNFVLAILVFEYLSF